MTDEYDTSGILDEFDDLDDAVQAADLPGVYVTLVSQNGTQAVPLTAEDMVNGAQGIAVQTALARSGWTFGAANQYFLGQTQVTMDHVLAAGQTLTIVGSAKGG